ARKFLESQARVDTKRIGAIGYCFGGSVALNMARTGEDLRAVASFHGALATQQPAQRGKVKAKVLSQTGEADPMIDGASIAAFEKEMKDAGVDYKVITYPGAKHGFTNPQATELGKKFNLPIEYNADADKKSWDEMLAFMKAAMK